VAVQDVDHKFPDKFKILFIRTKSRRGHIQRKGGATYQEKEGQHTKRRRGYIPREGGACASLIVLLTYLRSQSNI